MTLGGSIFLSIDFSLASFDHGIAACTLALAATGPGIFTPGTRVYPKNPPLAQRQDLALVKWP
jgi:hypothetical protein